MHEQILTIAVAFALPVATACGSGGSSHRLEQTDGGGGASDDTAGPRDAGVDARGSGPPAETGTDAESGTDAATGSDAPSGAETGAETGPGYDGFDGVGGSDSSVGVDTSSPDGRSRSFEPAIYRTHNKADVCGEPKVSKCTPSDMNWVGRVYGLDLRRPSKSWRSGSKYVYRVVGLVERVGPSSVDVFVYDENGKPLQGVQVAWWWSGVGSSQNAVSAGSVEPKSHFIPATTSAKGRAGFGLYGSAYLSSCGAGGPHALWISDGSGGRVVPSELSAKIGMLGGTNHRHLNIVYQRTRVGTQPSSSVVQCPLP